MASQAAILRAARAVPGGARPTPAPQGSQVSMGQISPLVWDEDTQAGYAYTYGPFLPRPPRTFTQGAFGPFSPILPVPVDEPPPGGELADPRRFQYPVGYNLPTPPGLDGFKLASFDTLYTLANLHSVTRTCIERRKMMVAGLDWDIVPTREAAKAYQGDHDAMRDFGERRAKAVRFFDRPDPDFDDFGSFMSALLEQVLVYDAMSLLIKPKRGRGLHRGVLGSDLDCLGLVDGATIRPLLSLSGGRPRPPAPGFQQFLFGVPRSDIPTMWSGKDIEEAGLKGYEGPVFTTDQLIYRPVVPRVNSPYGFSPVEMALVVIMTALRRQSYQLDYYNEGTVPAVYISPGDTTMTPAQIRELQSALNAFAGDQAWHHKIIVTPPGSRIDPMRPASLADQFDEIIMGEVAMVFDIDPMSLGIVPQVSTAVSPFAAKEMAQASRTVHERTSTKPLLKYLVSIVNAILHRVCSQDDMKFTFSGMDEAQDQAAQTDLLVKQFQNGFISVDEAREELQRTAWGLDETSGPLIMTQNGPVPLNQIIEMMRQQQPMQSGQNAPANSAGTATGSHQPRAVHHPPSSRPVGTHNPRLGLPSGSGGADIPSGSASDTPAHAAARAHQGTGKPAAKAVTAELEALARHVRKGRHITTWLPEHIPGVVMASLAEDLTKGIGIDEAVKGALAVALGPDAYQRAVKAAPQTPAQQQAQALAQQYATQIQAAFGQVATAAAPLIASWLAGTLAVTAAGLAAMITALAAKYLGEALRALWTAAWKAGTDVAAELLSTAAPHDEQAMQAWLDSHGRDWLEQIAGTREDEVAAGLDAAARSGQDADSIAAMLGTWLDAAARSALIAVTETWRALNAGMTAVARKLGAVEKSWQTRGDAKVCPACRANQDQGWVAFTQPFASGAMEPPQHPACRCRLRFRVALGQQAQKAAGRRYVDLPGQEWWTPPEAAPHGPAMGGGGRMHASHDADGIEQYIPGGVPGMTAGGEPPRWPGSETQALVAPSGDAVSAGRGDVQTRGGGTAGGPYRDFSDRTQAQPVDGGDDGDWPHERGQSPVPPRSWPQQGYMGGYWPSGGHGTTQPPVTSPGGGGPRGRPPNAVGKAAPALKDARPVSADVVYRQMLANYPPESIAWINDPAIQWYGPCEVPLDDVDVHDEDSWAAHHQPDAVDRFAAGIRAGTGHTDPVVMVRVPGQLARIIDGHHRYLACCRLGWPCKSYVGYTDRITRQMTETHSSQVHQGADPQNKARKLPKTAVNYRPSGGHEKCGNCEMIRPDADGGWQCTLVKGPIDPDATCDRWYGKTEKAAGKDLVAAGVAVRAADSGRVLMLQRAIDAGEDPAAGFWEFPGGRLEDGEEPYAAAVREWQEETRCQLPDGDLTGIWNAGNGRYRGYVLTIPSEDAVDIFGDRDDVDNPDDPDSDHIEALAWWDPGQLKDNPAVRPELAGDHKRFRRALKSAGNAETLREYWTHEAHPGPTHFAYADQIKWGTPGDFDRCTSLVMEHGGMSEEQAHGYCNREHHRALGYWPAQHARMVRDGEQ